MNKSVQLNENLDIINYARRQLTLIFVVRTINNANEEYNNKKKEKQIKKNEEECSQHFILIVLECNLLHFSPKNKVQKTICKEKITTKLSEKNSFASTWMKNIIIFISKKKKKKHYHNEETYSSNSFTQFISLLVSCAA